MKILDHIERWNIWRKHNLNSPVHKILVLFGLYSPTFNMTWTPKEQKEYEEEYMKLDPEKDGDSVAGNLTADDVIKRIEGRK